MKKSIIFCLIALSMMACSTDNEYANLDMAGMFQNQSPDTDTRFSASIAYNNTSGMVRDIVAPAEDYKLYILTDSHVDSTTYNLCKVCRAADADADCPLVIHLGDLINGQKHYARFDSAVCASLLTKPMYKTAGNHDLYYGQWTEFKKYYGTSTYSFVITTPSGKKDKYICLDSGSGTLGTKQLQWLRDELKETKNSYRHIVVYTHTHVFKQDGSQGHTSNYSLEETYELLGLMTRYGVDLVLMGHDHSREITLYGGVRYIIVDSVQDPQNKPFYMIASVGDKIAYEFVALPMTTGGLE